MIVTTTDAPPGAGCARCPGEHAPANGRSIGDDAAPQQLTQNLGDKLLFRNRRESASRDRLLSRSQVMTKPRKA